MWLDKGPSLSPLNGLATPSYSNWSGFPHEFLATVPHCRVCVRRASDTIQHGVRGVSPSPSALNLGCQRAGIQTQTLILGAAVPAALAPKPDLMAAVSGCYFTTFLMDIGAQD